ncbi:DNA replication protein [Klebsiella variicola]|uniref:DNA replication protein n=1 Tax=Klebsiella variicola TaxID=244366 RepID=UPI00101BF742|nr:DNA replication protein [Klebsiella variicola]
MSNISNLAEAREARRLQQPQNSGGKGFALLHRKIMDVPFYKDAEAAHLWVHLILKAKHAPEVVLTDLGEKLINRGQLLSGRNSLASETGLKPDRVQYLLRKFQKLGMVDWVSHGKFSVFTIVKYDDYQSNYVPADYQQITISNAGAPTPAEQPVPADYQKITTDKEYINNNLLPNGSKYVASVEEKPTEKTSRLSCEEVWQALREGVPDARGWNVLTPDRRKRIQKFWREAKPIAKQFGDVEPFGMESFRTYLAYLHKSCRWMFETRTDNATGKTWQKRNYEYILSAEIYAQTREGERDDR